jgi:hypothetical protein
MFGCVPFNTRQICVKEIVGKYEISIAFDDSCNKLADTLSRGDIRVYEISTNKDVTDCISFNTIIANIENLIMVNQWCKDFS